MSQKTKFLYRGVLVQPVKLATGKYSVLIDGRALMDSMGERKFGGLESLRQAVQTEIDDARRHQEGK